MIFTEVQKNCKLLLGGKSCDKISSDQLLFQDVNLEHYSQCILNLGWSHQQQWFSKWRTCWPEVSCDVQAVQVQFSSNEETTDSDTVQDNTIPLLVGVGVGLLTLLLIFLFTRRKSLGRGKIVFLVGDINLLTYIYINTFTVQIQTR